jgi:hypothetical protein
MPPTTQQQRIAEAQKRVNKEFEKALGGKIDALMTENAKKVWETKAFAQTVKNAIIKFGNNWFRDLANKRYVLRHVRMIARVARYFRDRAGDTKVSESQMKSAVDLVIQQARYACPTTMPGRSCGGYTNMAGLDV